MSLLGDSNVLDLTLSRRCLTPLPGISLSTQPFQMPFKVGDKVEVFYRMPFNQDNGQEPLDQVGNRWLLCPTCVMGTNRPRIGWTERWIPCTVVEEPKPAAEAGRGHTMRIRWDVYLWFDWASGEKIDTRDSNNMLDDVNVTRVRHRSPSWMMPPTPGSLPCGSEIQIGGVPVKVSFIVFRWGAAKIPIQYDSHSWGRTEGSTVSSKFVQLFFNRAVVPRLGTDYEVLTVFVQHSDEFAGISPEFLVSLCRGKSIVSLFFLWPIQGQQTYGDKMPCTAAYVDANPFFDLVTRMEHAGVVTRWPHHSQLWKTLTSKEWVPTLCMAPKYHIPLTTRVPKSIILVDPVRAAQQTLSTLRHLQAERRADWSYQCPANSDWKVGKKERCVVKLGYSYEGVDVKMVEGEEDLADALHLLATQPGYLNDCVYVQQRVSEVHLEARCFVVNGEVTGSLYTRFARIDSAGYVRDYEKAETEADAMRDWFKNDQEAWCSALQQIQILSRRWHHWMLTQSAEPAVSVRIDYLIEHVGKGKAEVWTGEVGEQGYSMGGIDPVVVFNAVLDTISPEVKQKRMPKPDDAGPKPLQTLISLPRSEKRQKSAGSDSGSGDTDSG